MTEEVTNELQIPDPEYIQKAVESILNGEFGTADVIVTQPKKTRKKKAENTLEMKPTNPKDAIGTDKLPLHLWPETATVMGCLGLLEGAMKYGRANWREAGVRFSIYIDALKRHANALFEGEDTDPDSGLPHLAHALACLAILIDAQAAGKLIDDRQYPGGYRNLVTEMTPHVKRIKELHKDKSPHHWTIQDVR